jgi:hypothetical protein
MRFWDTSALVPVVVGEAGTARARRWIEEDPAVITWVLTRLEIASAIERRFREGSIDGAARRKAIARFDEFAGTWTEVVDILSVRAHATRLLARHALRAADSAQLGAALLACEGEPGALPFVCLDRRLSEAAEREGFEVLGG